VPAIQVSDSSIKFSVPADLGIGAYEVTIGGATPLSVVLNRPTVYWIQGDRGKAATSGGWMRILGRSISFRPTTKARLVNVENSQEGAIELASTKSNLWEAAFAVPQNSPAGNYQVSIQTADNAWLVCGEISITPPALLPRPRVSVKEFGAKGDGTADDTSAIAAAIHAAVGKSELYFPAGRYKINGSLDIPPGTVLRGEDARLASLFWSDSSDVPESLLAVSGRFEISDVSLFASNYASFISNLGRNDPIGDIRLERVHVEGNPYRGRLPAAEMAKRAAQQEKFGSKGSALIALKGSNISITDSVLSAGARSISLVRARGAFIARNKIYNGRGGWYSISSPDGVIFESNEISGGDLEASGGGINTLDGSASAQNVIFEANIFSRMFGREREAVTTDGGGGFYFGNAISSSGSKIRLGKPAEGWGGERGSWEGASLFVLGGRGMGEVGLVRNADPSTLQVELTKAFEVPLDNSSVVTVVPTQRNFIFYKNQFFDAGLAIQYYGTSLNHIAAENRSVRTGGFFNTGRWYRHYQPSWYCQFIKNEIVEANFYRGGSNNQIESGVGVIGSFGFQRAPNRSPLVLGAIHRGNSLGVQGTMQIRGYDRSAPGVKDVIVEIQPSDRARVTIDEGAIDVVVRELGKK
jgi:hypothetical protein